MADLKYYDVILAPVVTEKTMNTMSEKKYTFSVHLFTLRLFNTPAIFFVLISSSVRESSTKILLSATLDVRADFTANVFSFLFILKE